MKLSSLDFGKFKKQQKKISVVTCYDNWSARIINQSAIDAVLVGDSAAMVMHGHADTLPIDIHTMALHVAAVVRGAPDKFVIADMPFLSFRKSLDSNVANAEVLMKAGANALKIEGAKGNLELIQHLVESGVPVMGHLGLTPQSVNTLGGFKVQGRENSQAEALAQAAKALQNAGCFSIVFECVPSALARKISEELEIPTIGIGAGLDTDGQVLVLQDMLGLNGGFKPKFLRKFLDGQKLILEALGEYHESVVNKSFPSVEESYE